MTTKHLTITLSPKNLEDLNLEQFYQQLHDDKTLLRSITVGHHGDEHPNLHVYIELSRAVRTDNYRRKFLPCVGGESIAKFALRVSKAYSFQQFVNYVMHEPDSVFMQGHNITDEERDLAISNFQNNKKQPLKVAKVKTLSHYNATEVLYQTCKKYEISVVDQHLTKVQLIAYLINDGYSVVPILRKLEEHVAEVNFRLSGNTHYLERMLSVIDIRTIV